ncbi:MAG: DUF1795 domain-containing protein [Planctomycetes bacterium]|nr:DUF1795 domain-containing protein [Planctomycetota bacterium]
MLRTVPAALVAALAAAMAAAGCDSKPAAPTTETFTSQAQGFSLTFPADWRKSTPGYGMDLEIIPPDQKDPNVFRDDIFVRVEGLADPMPLEDYFDVKVAKGVKNMPDYKEIEKGPARLGGTDARRLVYSYVNDDTPVTSITYFVVSGLRGYIVAANVVTDRFRDRRIQFEEIVQTFRLLNQPPPAPAEAPPAPPGKKT